ncbi:hypothetical protein TVAGG3_0233380, partial [Trichomonas vaginalis G3]
SSYCSIFDLATNEQVENKNSIQSEIKESLEVKQKFLVYVLSFNLTVDDTMNGFK